MGSKDNEANATRLGLYTQTSGRLGQIANKSEYLQPPPYDLKSNFPPLQEYPAPPQGNVGQIENIDDQFKWRNIMHMETNIYFSKRF